MRVLVTGAQGQVALSLVKRAQGGGIELAAIGRPELELEQPGEAAKIIGDKRPDVVVNAAAYTAVDKAEAEPAIAFRVNAEAAGEIAWAAKAHGAAMIQLSTDYVFDGSSEGAYEETDATNPLNVYGMSKLAGERLVREQNDRHIIVRTAWLYSPYSSNFVRTIMAASQQEKILSVVNDQRGSPTSALDLAEGLLAIIKRWASDPGVGLGETFHLAGTGSTSWFGLAEAIMDQRRARGLPAPEVQPISSSEWPTRAMRPSNSALSSRKFAARFGYAAPGWKQSLSFVVDQLIR